MAETDAQTPSTRLPALLQTMGQSTRIVETFNTHRMSDWVIEALATGRDDEINKIIPAIKRAAKAPQATMPSLIVYGERGSGKSFLMRLVQMRCQGIDNIACVLLPEEQHELSDPHQLLQIVTANVRGDSFGNMGYRFDDRDHETAWEQELEHFHAALDSRFGPGQGIAVVLLENFDAIVERLFGSKAPKVKSGSKLKPTDERRLAEERLRKLLNMRGGRFLLTASATGTVDMDYDRPLFQAFQPIDLESWTPDIAISYFNKRRELESLPPLSHSEQARARAIVEFVGGNARLAQLLGTVLSTNSARAISDMLDELVDRLSEYYRDRLAALPIAAKRVLGALIRNEPVNQSELARRMNTTQAKIADAFNYLVRGRLLKAAVVKGGLQNYRVRDRLFVHYYRRRNGEVSGLVAITELLEQFYTPDERAAQIRAHLARGEFDSARAFGRLPIDPMATEGGFCWFRDEGVTDGPPAPWFPLAGLTDAEIDAARNQLRDQPDKAFQYWTDFAQQAVSPVVKAAAGALAAIAASRNASDLLSEQEIKGTIERAQASGNIDAIIVANSVALSFYANRAPTLNLRNRADLTVNPSLWIDRAIDDQVRALGISDSALYAWSQDDFPNMESLARQGLALTSLPSLKLTLNHILSVALVEQSKMEQANETLHLLEQLAIRFRSNAWTIQSLIKQVSNFVGTDRSDDFISGAEMAVDLTRKLVWPESEAMARYHLGRIYLEIKDYTKAISAVKEGAKVALHAVPPNWIQASFNLQLESQIIRKQSHLDARFNAADVARQALEYAHRSKNDECLFWAFHQLFCVAMEKKVPDIVQKLQKVMDEYPDLDTKFAKYHFFDVLPNVAAKADALGDLLLLFDAHPRILEKFKANDLIVGMSQVARTWVESLGQSGRAFAFAKSGRDLQIIKELWDRMDSRHSEEFLTGLYAIAIELIKLCTDGGFLADISDLLVGAFDKAINPAMLLGEVAAFREAQDQQAHLNGLNPDLAIALRRILNLPEPESKTPTKRRRAR